MRTNPIVSASPHRSSRSGVTLMEILIAASMATLMLLASLQMFQRDGQLSRSTLSISVAETRAQEMLYGLERELTDSQGAVPIAQITGALQASATATLQVDSTLGFPDQSRLLLNRGTFFEEHIQYTGFNAAQTNFTGLVRGQQCTGSALHPAPSSLIWAPMAQVIDSASGPPASAWDGRTSEYGVPTLFRGDGTGFSYRIPVGINGDDIIWGGRFGTALDPDAWHALEFIPAYVVREADTGDDINRDGDRVDVFDIGQIRRRTWITDDPTVQAESLGMGPTMVIQEQCDWGSDLDGDGWDDPIFLWNDQRKLLHMRIFVLGTAAQGMPIVRRVESIIYLRN